MTTLGVPTRDDLVVARSAWQRASQSLATAVPYSSAQKVAEQAENATWERYKEVEKAFEHNLLIEMPDA